MILNIESIDPHRLWDYFRPVNSSYQMKAEANKTEVLGRTLMNKQMAIFKAHVSFRVSNSYFRDKKTHQQF